MVVHLVAVSYQPEELFCRYTPQLCHPSPNITGENYQVAYVYHLNECNQFIFSVLTVTPSDSRAFLNSIQSVVKSVGA